jgi:hypothetical protein
MADTSPFTIKDCFNVSMLVHKKGCCGKKYNTTRAKCALQFNKAAPTDANLHNLDKKTFLTGSVLDAKQSGRPRKDADVSAHLEDSVL